jgi:hypothetical protein
VNEEDPNMPAPISIVIPTLNAAETLGDCLNALMEGLDQALICELMADQLTQPGPLRRLGGQR